MPWLKINKPAIQNTFTLQAQKYAHTSAASNDQAAGTENNYTAAWHNSPSGCAAASLPWLSSEAGWRVW